MRRVSGALNRQTTTPVPHQRTRRQHMIQVLTSMPAGKCVPIAAIPLLREDAASLSIEMAFEMQETVEILMNAVNINVRATLVPTLADGRFRSMDDVNLSYTGNARPGEAVVPWIELISGNNGGGVAAVHHYLGEHAMPGDMVNASYLVAYNTAWNFYAKNLSPDIPLLDRLNVDLARAFWPRNQFTHIVPNFDDAAMEGEVALSLTDADLKVRRVGDAGIYDFRAPVATIGDLEITTSDNVKRSVSASSAGDGHMVVNGAPANSGMAKLHNLYTELDDVFAELRQNSLKISLANIQLAQQTQAWAGIRKKYAELPEEMLIDLLMDGITVPEQAWRQPIPLFSGNVVVGQQKRYASDGASLTESVTNGVTGLSFRVSIPAVPCGGVIIVTAEAAPGQLFERMENPWLHARSVDDLPAYMPDLLDPQKVDVVYNRRIDIDHDDPDDVYGYEPLNARWNNFGPKIGGRFYRPQVDAGFDEDRQRIWAVETQNPTLTEDAYLVPADIHLKPFVSSLIEPFDCLASGSAVITGNTVFGGALIESTAISDYDKVLERVQTERIEK